MSKKDFDTKLALSITNKVSTMDCAYLFCIIALISLPSILTTAFNLHVFPKFMVASGLVLIVAWIAQTFIQLVLLSVIMVGQKIQADTTISHVKKLHTHVDKIHKHLGIK